MPNTTDNYGLKKPTPEEFYDVGVQNENMDKVDAELKNLNDEVENVETTAKNYTDQQVGSIPDPTWNNLQGKPTTFPPSTHSHPISQVTNLQTELNAKETPAGVQQKVNAHADRTDNPHGTTKAQVGLSNVDNVKQASKQEHDQLAQTVSQNTTNISDLDQTVSKHLADEAKHVSLADRDRWDNTLTTTRTGKDDNSIFQTVEKKRTDGTLFAKSVFSNPNADENYTVRTYTEYDTDGLTPVKTSVFDLTYDDDGDFVSEVMRS